MGIKSGQPVALVADGVGAYGALAVTATATMFFDQNQTRRSVTLYNVGPDTCYLGYDEDVDEDNGFPIPMGAGIVEDQNESAIYLVCASGDTADVRYTASDDVAAS